MNDVPEYRKVYGEVKGWNPYRGWIAVIIDEPRISEKLSNTSIIQSIAEIVALAGQSEGKHGTLQIPFPVATSLKLGKMVGFQTEFTLFIANTVPVRILDAVKNIIMNWSIKLEEDGILGDGLSFSQREKEVAERTSYHITNFYGTVQSSQIQQQTTNSSQVMNIQQTDLTGIQDFIQKLREEIDGLKLQPDVHGEINSDIPAIESQLRSPNPKQGIVMEGLASIRRILEGTAGGIAARLLADLVKSFLGLPRGTP